MRSFLLTLFIIFISNSTDAQIIFSLYGRSECSNDIIGIKHFGLEKNGILFTVQKDEGVLVLKETGSYQLKYVLEDIDTSQLGRTFRIKENDTHVKDTISIYAIQMCSEPTTNPNFVGFCCCEEKCNGRIIDYYSNGNKRLEGCFKGGKPIGKLKYYHANGYLIKTEKYSKEGKLKRVKNYDP